MQDNKQTLFVLFKGKDKNHSEFHREEFLSGKWGLFSSTLEEYFKGAWRNLSAN